MDVIKHTPAPWKVDTSKTGIVLMSDYFRVEQTAIAEMLPDGMTLEYLEHEGDANARLIAAAPEMIIALKLISPIIDVFINQTPSGIERIKLCDINILVKSAIDKATN